MEIKSGLKIRNRGSWKRVKHYPNLGGGILTYYTSAKYRMKFNGDVCHFLKYLLEAS